MSWQARTSSSDAAWVDYLPRNIVHPRYTINNQYSPTEAERTEGKFITRQVHNKDDPIL